MIWKNKKTQQQNLPTAAYFGLNFFSLSQIPFFWNFFLFYKFSSIIPEIKLNSIDGFFMGIGRREEFVPQQEIVCVCLKKKNFFLITYCIRLRHFHRNNQRLDRIFYEVDSNRFYSRYIVRMIIDQLHNRVALNKQTNIFFLFII